MLMRKPDESGDRIATIAPFTKDLRAHGDRPTVHLCEKQSCQETITELEELKTALEKEKFK